MKRLPILTLVVLLLLGGTFFLLQHDSALSGKIKKSLVKYGIPEKWFFEGQKFSAKNEILDSPNNSIQDYSQQDRSPQKDEAGSINNHQASGLLQESLVRLKQYYAIQAKLQEYIFMKGVKYSGTGNYAQSGPRRLKLQLQMQAGSSTGDLLQVSDGQLLWTEFKLGPVPPDLPEDQWPHYFRVERRNLSRIEDRLLQLNDPETAQHFWDLGSGGIAALVASFAETIDFKMGNPQSVQGIPCHVLTGYLNPRFKETAQYLQKKRQYIAEDSLPVKVILYLDQHRLFPIRYEYYRKNGSGGEAPLLQVEFSEITFNGSPDLREFVYDPPHGYFPHDVTRDYLTRVKSLISETEEQKTSIR